MTENWTGQELLLSFVYILIPTSPVKMSQEPSFLVQSALLGWFGG